MSTKVLVIGSGGREHALAWSLVRSPQVDHVYVAPGNGGTAQMAQVSNVAIDANDITGLCQFALDNQVDLTVVGPEIPLSAGIVDTFQTAHLKIFGPTQAAARLESSKAFAKAFMEEHDIPTLPADEFTDYKKAKAHLDEMIYPDGLVVKASGLAAGKGVFVCDTIEEAQEAIKQLMVDRVFGDAGNQVLIEERLIGREISILAFCDGKLAVPLIPARDHKRVYDGGQGPNTGGMGVYAPARDVSFELVELVRRTILQPTLDGMAEQGTPYVGILYAGLMLTDEGPYVLEFNSRFGDPETQAVLPMLKNDLYEILCACVAGTLDKIDVIVREGACVTVIMASGGYPDSYEKGLPIKGIEKAEQLEDVMVFHAGTQLVDKQLVTSGGRVLAVTALGKDVKRAAKNAYKGVAKIKFDNAHYRRDIGL